MPIDDKLKVAQGVRGIAGAILPALKSTDLNEQVNYIIKNEPIVAEYVKRNPAYRQQLLDIAKVQYPKYRSLIWGANMVDSADRLTSGAGLVAEGLGPGTAGAGTLASLLEEGGEMVFKLPYMLAYTRSGDYSAIPYWMALEAASTIPVLGDAIDMSNAYSNRAYKMFRGKIAEDFLASVSKGKSRTQH